MIIIIFLVALAIAFFCLIYLCYLFFNYMTADQPIIDLLQSTSAFVL